MPELMTEAEWSARAMRRAEEWANARAVLRARLLENGPQYTTAELKAEGFVFTGWWCHECMKCYLWSTCAHPHMNEPDGTRYLTICRMCGNKSWGISRHERWSMA